MPGFNTILTNKSSVAANAAQTAASKNIANQKLVSGASLVAQAMNPPPPPSYWLEKGMVWPFSDFSIPWGATDYGSLVSWISVAKTIYGGPLILMPANWYDGKPVSATDLPIAYYPNAMPHIYPFLVWASPQVVGFWTQALNSIVGQLAGFDGFWDFETYYGTQGPLIPQASLSELWVSSPQGNQNVAVRYVGISPSVPPAGGNIFFGAA